MRRRRRGSVVDVDVRNRLDGFSCESMFRDIFEQNPSPEFAVEGRNAAERSPAFGISDSKSCVDFIILRLT